MSHTQVKDVPNHTTFRTSTTTCCLPRLPAASHDYLLPPTTTCCLPRLPAASHDYLLPPMTTCCLPRLPAASHDYLLLPTTICCVPRLSAASPWSQPYPLGDSSTRFLLSTGRFNFCIGCGGARGT